MTIQHREAIGKVRTKIVATVGPGSSDRAVLGAMIEAGVDVFRLNFSHGTQEEHSTQLRDIRELAEAAGRSIAVLQDLGGPKIRLGAIPGDEVDCRLGDEFLLVADETSGDPHRLTCTYRELVGDLKAGDVVLFADGNVAMIVDSVDANGARLKVTLEGKLRSRQGINVPGVALGVSTLTDKDRADLDWTASHAVEYVGLSFVRKAADVVELRQELER
ncbi:pyruvate kinase, partial [Singulisphaera rosea]